jgi:hypothetical protein
MATTLKTKNSVTTTVAPTSLAQGELAVNITDKKMWVGNAATTPVQIVGAGATNRAGGSNTQVQYNSSGDLAGSANMTFSGTALTLANDASISGLTVGKGAGSDSGSTVLGSGALAGSNTGANNLAIGKNTLAVNTSGAQNTGLGYATLNANTSGADNVAIGHIALYSNTTGSNNVAVGRQALQANTTASNNTAVGYQALYSYTTNGGNANNTALGYQAGYSTTTSVQNTFIGSGSGYSNSTGSYNIALGFYAGYSNTTNSGSCFVGYYSGQASTGAGNNFFGYTSGYLVTSGAKNTILGGYNGNQGGLDIRTASNYIVLSDGDGNPRMYIDNNGSIYPNGTIYYQTNQNMRFPSTGGTGYVGYITSASNFQISYNSTGAGVALTSGATSWGTFSDSRLKNVTGTYTNALADIAQIEPVKFTWKSDAENKPQVGVLAQSVQNVVPEAIESSTIEIDGTEEYLQVRYTELIPLMIASIQELKAEVDSLKQQLGK